MDDKTRNEITESINDAVFNIIDDKLFDHRSKFDNDDIITSSNGGRLFSEDGIIEFTFRFTAQKIK